jgi:hypothetical protein
MRVLLSSTEPEFAEVLDSTFRSAGLEYSAPDPRRPRGAQSIAARLQQFFENDRERRASTPSDPLELYLANQKTNRKKSRPSRAVRAVDPRSVANELGIAVQMTVADLNRLRREYALANHPDRVALADRENATRRMMLANMLIDREIDLRQRPRPQSGR